VRFVETFDEGAGEVGAFRDGEGKSLFQRFLCFLGHGLILRRNVIACGVSRPRVNYKHPRRGKAQQNTSILHHGVRCGPKRAGGRRKREGSRHQSNRSN
jgi:hypothetical protein